MHVFNKAVRDVSVFSAHAASNHLTGICVLRVLHFTTGTGTVVLYRSTADVHQLRQQQQLGQPHMLLHRIRQHTSAYGSIRMRLTHMLLYIHTYVY